MLDPLELGGCLLGEVAEPLDRGQARATLEGVAAARFPQLAVGERAQRLKISANRPLSNYAAPNFSTVQNDYALALNVSYEADLSGRIQRSIEGARASAEQSAIDFEKSSRCCS